MSFLSTVIQKFYWDKHRSLFCRLANYDGIGNFAEYYNHCYKRKINMQSRLEAFNIFNIFNSVKKVEGEIAEVGVYFGDTAEMLARIKGEKELFLFDTFAGFPYDGDFSGKDKGREKGESYHKGGMKADLHQVMDRMQSYKKVRFCAGVFPQTGAIAENKRFCFVHIDVDLHQPTLEALKFFYSRINTGGTIIVHDYGFFDGVKKAVNEFFANKKEVVLRISENQALIQKTR